MLFQVTVYNGEEIVYQTDVADIGAAKRTAQYMAVKYDMKADRITVVHERAVAYQLLFDVKIEDWIDDP